MRIQSKTPNQPETKPERELRTADERPAVATSALAEALTRVRKQAGLRAKDIAAQLEVSAPRIAQVESEGSNITLATLLKYAEAAGCEVEIRLRPHDPSLPTVSTPLSSTK
jgi:predicted XRE-type DNA-binding protein